jgi:hypothetical protein
VTSQFVSVKRGEPLNARDESGISIESALNAIRSGRSEELESVLRRLDDREGFFFQHHDVIADAACESDSVELLFVLLKFGFTMTSHFMERVYRKGNPDILKFIEERMDKGRSRERWEREAKYYKNKYRFKVVSR